VKRENLQRVDPSLDETVAFDPARPWLAVGADAHVHIMGRNQTCVVRGLNETDPSKVVIYQNWSKSFDQVITIHDVTAREIGRISLRDEFARELYDFLRAHGKRVFAAEGFDVSKITKLLPHRVLMNTSLEGKCHLNTANVVEQNPQIALKAQFAYSLHVCQCSCCAELESHSYISHLDPRSKPDDPLVHKWEITRDHDHAQPVKVVIDDPVLTSKDYHFWHRMGSAGAFNGVGHSAERFGARAGGNVTWGKPQRLMCNFTPPSLPAGFGRPYVWHRRAVIAVLYELRIDVPANKAEARAAGKRIKAAGIGLCALCDRVDFVQAVVGTGLACSYCRA
jgi:hypothetical protein